MRGGANAGHRKVGRHWMRYIVYNNRTDELVILDGTAEECAKAMKIHPKSFYSAVTRAESGAVKKWHIEKIFADELAEEV